MPSNMKLCETCEVKFAGNHFINSSVCRYCLLKAFGTQLVERLEKAEAECSERLTKMETDCAERLGKMETSLKELTEKLEKKDKDLNKLSTDLEASKKEVENTKKDLEDAKTKLASLQEFTTANVGCTTGPVVAPKEAPFIRVRNGVRPSCRKEFVPVITSNRFELLATEEKLFATEEEDSSEVRIVGDSMVRDQINEFCGRAPKTRKHFCMPGGRLDDITAACEEASRECEENTLFVLHAGTNDVQSTRSEELMEKYKRMIERFKTKSRNIIVSGILPRRGARKEFYDRAFSTNNRLQTLCSKEGIGYVNLWNDFYDLYGTRELFSEDGLHLNPVGSARFGRLLNEAVIRHRKNFQQPRTDPQT